MSKTAWTPGPWRVEEGTTLVWGNCNPDDRSSWGMGYPVTDAYRAPDAWLRDKIKDGERDANARLIAAAPELYEALETVIKYKNGDGKFNFSRLADWERSIAAMEAWEALEVQILAALAKARGE